MTSRRSGPCGGCTTRRSAGELDDWATLDRMLIGRRVSTPTCATLGCARRWTGRWGPEPTTWPPTSGAEASSGPLPRPRQHLDSLTPSRGSGQLPVRPKPDEPGPRTTHGRGVDADGREYQFSSSNQQDKELIAATNDRLRQRGYLPGRATSSRASDVEQKVATQMRLHGTERADLVVNNPDGPCRVRLGCDQSLPGPARSRSGADRTLAGREWRVATEGLCVGRR